MRRGSQQLAIRSRQKQKQNQRQHKTKSYNSPMMQEADDHAGSLDAGQDSDAQAAWHDEIARRIQDLDSGTAEAIPWTEVRRRIAAKLVGIDLPEIC